MGLKYFKKIFHLTLNNSLDSLLNLLLFIHFKYSIVILKEMLSLRANNFNFPLRSLFYFYYLY